VQIADLTRLSRVSINRYLTALRERMAQLCERAVMFRAKDGGGALQMRKTRHAHDGWFQSQSRTIAIGRQPKDGFDKAYGSVFRHEFGHYLEGHDNLKGVKCAQLVDYQWQIPTFSVLEFRRRNFGRFCACLRWI